jgi:hypothetical protein
MGAGPTARSPAHRINRARVAVALDKAQAAPLAA